MGMLPPPPPSKKFGHSVFSWRQAHSVIALGYYSTLQSLSLSLYLLQCSVLGWLHILDQKYSYCGHSI